MDETILSVNHLTFCFKTEKGDVHAVNDVGFSLKPGEILGIVGESGCGKSVTSKCIARLNPEPPGYFCCGEVLVNGRNTLKLGRKELRKFRAEEIGYVFQNPFGSLNPTMKIGRQVEEALFFDKRLTRSQRKERAKEILEKVGLVPVEDRYNQYPHELSGGMRQRVVIAMALVKKPKLLVCDEPTTALDVTIEADILGLLLQLKQELGIAMIMITHNIGVISRMCDKLIVMYAGWVVESGTVEELFGHPAHPYLRDLMKSVIRNDMDKEEELSYIPGMPPDLVGEQKGCPYADRCSKATDLCKKQPPREIIVKADHMVKCHIYEDVRSGKESL